MLTEVPRIRMRRRHLRKVLLSYLVFSMFVAEFTFQMTRNRSDIFSFVIRMCDEMHDAGAMNGNFKIAKMYSKNVSYTK
jgi:hypothetical protein